MLRNSTQHVCLNAVAAAVLLYSGTLSGQAKDKQLVLVYNTASVAPEVLILAEKQASRIFREGVIELQWLNCPEPGEGSLETDPCREHFHESPLYLHVLASAGAFPNERALAHAAVTPEGGVRATVFFDRVQKFMASSGADCNLVQMLGHVMAHEMGHLLLSFPGHSSKGIMAGPWSGKELQQAALGGLLFTPSEAAKMREAVKQRARSSLAARDR
jgi:hypothetical protein